MKNLKPPQRIMLLCSIITMITTIIGVIAVIGIMSITDNATAALAGVENAEALITELDNTASSWLILIIATLTMAIIFSTSLSLYVAKIFQKEGVYSYAK